MVVGGGVAGLVAARDLAATGRDVLLLEGSPAGRRQAAQRRGRRAHRRRRRRGDARPPPRGRRPRRASSARRSSHPTAATSGVWSRGALRAMPRSLMGVPFDLDQLAASGVLSPEGLARARAEAATAVDDDVSVGDLVAARLGDEIVDRLVEPLLGGVYAGHARRHLRRRGRAAAARDGPPRQPARAGRRRTGLDRPGLRRPARRHGPPARPGRRGRWLRGAHLGDRPRAAAYAVGLGAAPSAPPRIRRPSRRTRSCSPRRPRRRPGCSAEVAPGAAAELARDRVRQRRGRDAGLPRAGRARRALRPVGLPRAAGRAAHDQGVDVLLRQVGAGCATSTPTSSCCAPRSGATARRRRCRPATRGWCGSRSPTSRRWPASPPAGRHPRPALGRRAAAVRRRPPRPGRPDPRRRRRAAGAGGLRGGVRRRRHPGRASGRPAALWPRLTRAE